jgi:hypothetical protein
MSKQIAVVVRGCIELPPADDDESERKGRTTAWSRLRRFHPGELVTLLAADFLRLQRLGIVKALTP